MRIEFDLTPVGYKRMTRFSKYNAEMQPYYAYHDALRWHAKQSRFTLPDQFAVTFHLPMPPSWSQKKRDELRDTPHQQKPDASNLLKALEDALKENDQTIWDVHVRKLWADRGGIIIYTDEGGD